MTLDDDLADMLLADCLPPPTAFEAWQAEVCRGFDYPPSDGSGRIPVFPAECGIAGQPWTPPDDPWNEQLRTMIANAPTVLRKQRA